jgi:hypothetical protein
MRMVKISVWSLLPSTLDRMPFRRMKSSAMRRCPVEDTGMNSVRPSMRPRKREASQSGMGRVMKKGGRLQIPELTKFARNLEERFRSGISRLLP